MLASFNLLVGDLPNWRRRLGESVMSMATKTLEAFKQRFSPSVIFERAGITAMLAANRAVWQIEQASTLACTE